MTTDRTIQRNYIQNWRFLVAEYELVKAGKCKASSAAGKDLANLRAVIERISRNEPLEPRHWTHRQSAGWPGFGNVT